MQTINFNDTLNDQNVSTFASHEGKPQYFIDKVNQIQLQERISYSSRLDFEILLLNF
ncbi:hypothetical protein [Flammeovirga kamogawensis]|uniref:Uncharacterized protein n=1 Tax=Flammeovirga kamogawensis TaxID=373891 RepID=A0ABX8H417_9BACT|nr:hypothetical protein [Flammeovirga kamogawensis]MBB6461844.1 hypothetical protein [Flammeovirga kamogawensis]QWG10541.1 hypothetical protein KM029_26575 [Flammeovirga kamogawensis]